VRACPVSKKRGAQEVKLEIFELHDRHVR